MSPEITFAASALTSTAIGTVLTIGSAALLGSLAVPKVASFVLPHPKETRLSDYIPFRKILPDGKTVVCDDGSHVRFIAITGTDQSFIRLEDEIHLYKARRKMFDDLGEESVTLRLYTFRDKVNLGVDYEFPNKIAQKIGDTWLSQFEEGYQTRTVIAVSAKNKNRARLNDIIGSIITTLDPYQPMELTQDPASSPDNDLTIGSVLGRLASPVSRPEPNGFGDYLNSAICGDIVEFEEDGTIKFTNNKDVKFAKAIGIKSLGDQISTKMTEKLSSVSAEMTILQVIEPQSKAKSMLLLQQQGRMMQSTSFSSAVSDQYAEALRMIEGLDDDKATLCVFSEVIFVYADTREKLEEHVKHIHTLMKDEGQTPSIEKGVAQTSWFTQFPTIDAYPRYYRLMSHSIALVSTFNKPPSGLDRSHWGEGPIAPFFTGSNTIYKHQHHVSARDAANAHAVCIAPTESGKTTFFTFMSLMTSRLQNVSQFLFDRYYGQYIYTTAMGGKYMAMQSEPLTMSDIGGMNPFTLEDNRENRAFLNNWLTILSGGLKDHESNQQRAQAIDIAFNQLDEEHRSLRAIYDGAFTPNTELKNNLLKWVDPAQYGELFNAPKDAIDLEGNWLTTFDMTTLMENPEVASATVFYLMHRIRQTLIRKQKKLRKQIAGGYIFIDETAPLLTNEDFKMMFRIMLQEFRKINAGIISVFQRPAALIETGVQDLLLSQAGTYYLFPNPSSNPKEYAAFNLTDRELSYILEENTSSRQMDRSFLIKRPTTRESVIVDIDLGILGPKLKIMNSDSSNVHLVSELQRKFPSAWIEKYLGEEV